MSVTAQNRIFNVTGEPGFHDLALKIFHYQSQSNPVYKQYLNNLRVEAIKIKSLNDIPFLPVEFFKSHKVITGNSGVQQVFKSSGTTGAEHGRHYVSDKSLYEESFRKGFEFFFGNADQYCILALLPSYVEREDSSLVYMVKDLIKQSNHPDSGFYLINRDELAAKIQQLDKKKQKTILLGVTFALLDFVEKYKLKLKHSIIMETGGMKGNRKEMVREEIHHILCEGFGVNVIYSEYGMTELLSQAYSKANGIFNAPPWMKVLIRDVEDPFSYLSPGRTGGINIVDLANINSCSFIATQDLGKLHPDGSFEVLGRFDNSDLRGCNLMIE